MKMRVLIGGAVALLASVAVAHEGVNNPAVKARMQAMGVIGANTKIIGEMAQGKTAFDAAAAQAAAQQIAAAAGQTVALFQAQEDDPKSEALPAIWQNFDDFTAKSNALAAAATAATTSITDAGSLQMAVRQIGGTCRDCHRTYRE